MPPKKKNTAPRAAAVPRRSQRQAARPPVPPEGNNAVPPPRNPSPPPNEPQAPRNPSPAPEPPIEAALNRMRARAQALPALQQQFLLESLREFEGNFARMLDGDEGVPARPAADHLPGQYRFFIIHLCWSPPSACVLPSTLGLCLAPHYCIPPYLSSGLCLAKHLMAYVLPKHLMAYVLPIILWPMSCQSNILAYVLPTSCHLQ